jgi:fructose-specific phosphotransferase system IIC component
MAMYRALIAIISGIAAAFALRYINHALLVPAESCCGPPNGIMWPVLLSSPIGALITLLPAALAGWISHNRGLLCGFIVGALTSALFMTLYGSFWSTSGTDPLTVRVLEFSLDCFAGGIFGFAAGGAAQLVRSNNSFKPNPLRGSA